MTLEEQIRAKQIQIRLLELDEEEARAKVPGSTVRDVAASAITGPSQAMAGMIDILQQVGAAKNDRGGYGYARGPNAFKSAEQIRNAPPVEVSPVASKVQEFRDWLAGRKVQETPLTAIATGATGGMLFPGGPVVNALAGGASGGASQVAADAGASSGAQMGVGLTAGLGSAGIARAVQGMIHPNKANQVVGKAVREMTPEQMELAARRTAAAGDLNPMAWQAAPSGTSLRTLGEKAAREPAGTQIQARLQEQAPKANNETLRAANPDWEATASTPLRASLGRRLRDRVAGLREEHQLQPGGARDKGVQTAAGRFAQDDKLTGAVNSRVRTVGQLENIREELAKANKDPDIGPQIQKLITELTPKEHQQVLAKLRDSKDIIADVKGTTRLAGKHADPQTDERSKLAPLISQISSPITKTFRFLRGLHPEMIAKEQDKLLSKDINALIRELEKRQQGNVLGVAASSASAANVPH